MRLFLSLVSFFAFLAVSVGQSQQLANKYYETGEYEKSASIYKKLYDRSQNNSHFFERYVSSLTEMENFEEAESVIKKKLKRKKKEISLYVMLGKLNERKGDESEADKQYQKAISKLSSNPNMTSRIGNLFIKDAKLEYALAAYKEGIKHVKNPKLYAYNMGDLYYRLGDVNAAVDYFLISLADHPGRARSLKTFFQRNLDEKGFDIVKNALYEKIQAEPDIIQFPEMLQWTFEIKKQYDKALIQAKAMDRRLQEDGRRVYNLGLTAYRAKDYKTAIKAFQYIGETKEKNSSYYLTAKKDLLIAKRSSIVENPNYTLEELNGLVKEYDAFLDLYGRNNQTASIMIEYARLYAEYKSDHKKAIEILTRLTGLRNINKEVMSEAKLALGDYYIIDGDVWEATLLYSQVDKEFKEADLGERARFKNAKLSYFNGDFEWAQEQFDFLKSATSKLISNDAIDLSVFITDNLGLDSTETAMKMYAKADLLVFQHKYDEAQELLGQLLKKFPEHSLRDDVLYTKAQIFTKKRLIDEAIASYKEIVEKYPEEIRADNALFQMAILYQKYKNQPEKAIPLFEKVFIDYSGSTFAVEARKIYRELRGDSVQ